VASLLHVSQFPAGLTILFASHSQTFRAEEYTKVALQVSHTPALGQTVQRWAAVGLHVMQVSLLAFIKKFALHVWQTLFGQDLQLATVHAVLVAPLSER
jgi:hypothetical protein